MIGWNFYIIHPRRKFFAVNTSEFNITHRYKLIFGFLASLFVFFLFYRLKSLNQFSQFIFINGECLFRDFIKGFPTNAIPKE